MTVRVEKIIGSLPSTLDENTLYFVRTGTGFSLYFTDATGMIAHNLNSDNIAILNTQIKNLVEQNTVAGARRISGIAQNGISLNQLAGFMVTTASSAGLLAATTLVSGDGPVYVTVYGD